jgi:hypothetical protein
MDSFACDRATLNDCSGFSIVFLSRISDAPTLKNQSNG